MKWLIPLFSIFSAPVFAMCEAEVSLHSGVNWAGFHVEVAATAETRAQGLMGRENIAHDEGMLFLYPEAQLRTFWMKNTPSSLDILFFDDSNRLINVHKMTEPFSEAHLPSNAASAIVLEIKGGIFDLFSMQEDATRLRVQPVAGETCPAWVQEKYAVN